MVSITHFREKKSLLTASHQRPKAPSHKHCLLFVFQIFVDTFCTSFTCTHSKDNSSCTCYGITTGINSRLWMSVPCFFFSNNTFSLVDLKTFCSRRNQVGSEKYLRDMITVSTSMSYSEPSISTGRLLPDASGSPSSILIHVHTFYISRFHQQGFPSDL